MGNGYILSIDLRIYSMAANYSPLHLENMPDFQKPAIQFKELVLLCRYIIKLMAGLLTSDGPDLIQQHPFNTSFCQDRIQSANYASGSSRRSKRLLFQNISSMFFCS